MSNNIRSFDEAEDFIGDSFAKPLPGSHMKLIDDGTSEISVYYYDTPIVTYLLDGGFILYSGGWRTQSTMIKMNKYLPTHIQISRNKSNIWEVHDLTRGTWAFYSDKMTIYPSANLEFVAEINGDDVIKSIDLRRKADWYTDGYMNCLIDGYMHLEQDVPSLEPSQEELQEGRVGFLTKNQAKKIINGNSCPPSLLRRALYVDKSDAIYFDVAEEMINLSRSSWNDQVTIDSAKIFRRAINRLLRKSLEVTV